MSNNELKTLTIGEKEFSIVKLEPWKRLTFIADFQKEFLSPALKNLGEGEAKAMFSDGNNLDILSLLSAFSTLVDGSRLEFWTKRILAEGLVIYTRDDGQRAKLAFSEINNLFSNPADILILLKEVLVFNMEDISGLLNSFNPAGTVKSKINIVDNI